MKFFLEHPDLLEAVIEVLGALALAATPLLVRWFRAHGVAIDEKQAQQIDLIARQAAGYAEEWARAKAKGGPAPDGAEKRAVAIDAARSLATGALAKLAEDKWGIAIEAKLPELRVRMSQLPPPLPPLEPLP